MTGPAGNINPASVARSSLMSELVSTHVLYTVLSVYSYIFSPAALHLWAEGCQHLKKMAGGLHGALISVCFS